MPPTSSPISSHSPVCIPTRSWSPARGAGPVIASAHRRRREGGPVEGRQEAVADGLHVAAAEAVSSSRTARRDRRADPASGRRRAWRLRGGIDDVGEHHGKQRARGSPPLRPPVRNSSISSMIASRRRGTEASPRPRARRSARRECARRGSASGARPTRRPRRRCMTSEGTLMRGSASRTSMSGTSGTIRAPPRARRQALESREPRTASRDRRRPRARARASVGCSSPPSPRRRARSVPPVLPR